MAIKVHGNVMSTATQRVLACLNEKGLGYEFVSIDMRAGEHKKEPFTTINPFGQVPGLEDEDLKLFESRAINKYIAYAYADNGTPLVFKEPKKMAIVGVGLEVEAHHFDGPASKLAWELVVKPMKGIAIDDAIVKEHEAQLAKVLDLYEIRLTECKYLSGDTFTLTDLHHLPAVTYLMATPAKALFDTRPHVSAWVADIMARPAWQKVVAMKNNN
ncbi:glutathione s-transferase parb [Phtheirospermum japonicum]|uniref:glutathione transferase n=1 Tax=Phtheirospermum japonicum TaxID=374723 RepID=A0A830BP61_9LAMI|nr:glutathione s-transferase parb [Phtheirospermum japonicum]